MPSGTRMTPERAAAKNASMNSTRLCASRPTRSPGANRQVPEPHPGHPAGALIEIPVAVARPVSHRDQRGLVGREPRALADDVSVNHGRPPGAPPGAGESSARSSGPASAAASSARLRAPSRTAPGIPASARGRILESSSDARPETAPSSAARRQSRRACPIPPQTRSPAPDLGEFAVEHVLTHLASGLGEPGQRACLRLPDHIVEHEPGMGSAFSSRNCVISAAASSRVFGVRLRSARSPTSAPPLTSTTGPRDRDAPARRAGQPTRRASCRQ